MAKLGTPTKDENGRLIQRWYPVEGDIRPDGLEMLCKVNGIGPAWEPVPVSAPISSERAYRIPSTYIPPSGWYCVPDNETVMEGDRYHIDDRQGDIGSGHFGCVVSQFRRAFGGWVLRREPQEQPATVSEDDKWEMYVPQIGEMYAKCGQYRRRGSGQWKVHPSWSVVSPTNDEFEYRRLKEQPCQSSESVEGVHIPDTSGQCAASATDSANQSSGPGLGEEASQDSSSNATHVAAPVAWQFTKRPMERVVDHWRLLAPGKDTIQEGDEYWNDGDWRKWSVFIGDELEDEIPSRRAVYAPLPARLEDVPDGRVIEQHQLLRWRHDGAWYTQTPANYISSDQPSRFESFTITEYVAELRPVE